MLAECFPGSSRELRAQAVYEALGGSDCFLGLSPDEQEHKIYEALGGTGCFLGLSPELRREAIYVAAGGTEDCFLGRSPGEQHKLFYEVLYANAGSPDNLVDPSCFSGLAPFEQESALFGVLALGLNLHPECTPIAGSFPFEFPVGSEGKYYRAKYVWSNGVDPDLVYWGDAVGPIAAAPLAPVPEILWWKFNEASGTVISGAVGPDGTTDADRVVNGSGFALDLNGSSDNATSDSAVTYGGAPVITVCVHVTSNTGAGVQIIAESGDGTLASSWIIYINSDRLLGAVVAGGGGLSRVESIALPASPFHLGIVLDASDATGQVKIFINGVEQATDIDNSPSGSSFTFADATLHVGARNNATFFFDGVLDDLCIFDHELTGAEITARKDNLG